MHSIRSTKSRGVFACLMQVAHPVSITLSWHLCLTLVVLSSAQAPPPGGRICEKSGYCSLDIPGKSHFVGQIDSTAQLQAALDALAYKKEIIITSETRLGFAAQTIAHIQNAGYGHILFVASNLHTCDRLSAVFPKIGCGYYGSINEWHPRFQPFMTEVMIRKYLTAARTIRFGYNTMIVDADSMVFNDIYYYVKRPPLADINLINQREGGHSSNGGFVYVQNASPSGPAAYAVADVVFRNARSTEDSSSLMAMGVTDKPTDYGCNDQVMLNDAVHSTVAGRPTFTSCVCWTDKCGTQDEAMTALAAAQRNATGKPGDVFETLNIEMPVEDRGLIGGKSHYPLTVATMTMPHYHGVWPRELGGNYFGKASPRENLNPGAKEMLRMLTTPTNTPMWPDPENMADEAAAAATKKELFAYAPIWFVCNYHPCGINGHWNRALTNDSRSVWVHMHAGLPPGAFSKKLVYMTTGNYDFSLMEKVFGGPYIASHTNKTLPPLLAYAPDALPPTISKEAFVLAVENLARLGVLMKRMVAYPAIPLTAPFAQMHSNRAGVAPTNRSQHSIPFDYLAALIVMPFGNTLDTLQGCWAMYASSQGCLHEEDRNRGAHHGHNSHFGRALLPMEFAHHLSRLPSSQSAVTADNTLAGLAPTNGPDDESLADITADAVEAQVVFKAAQHLLYIPRLVKVGPMPAQAEEQFSNWRSQCCALQHVKETRQGDCQHMPYFQGE